MFGKIRATGRGGAAAGEPPSPAEKADPANAGHVAAPFLGTVTVLAEQGQQVSPGDTVATIEAMKMEATITASRAGTVTRLAVTGTRPVEGGDLVLELS